MAISISPRARKRLAAILVVVCVIAWPVTALTVFAAEPMGILGLSWFALILTSADIYLTTDVRESNDGEG